MESIVHPLSLSQFQEFGFGQTSGDGEIDVGEANRGAQLGLFKALVQALLSPSEMFAFDEQRKAVIKTEVMIGGLRHR